jgi:hypothetical protein
MLQEQQERAGPSTKHHLADGDTIIEGDKERIGVPVPRFIGRQASGAMNPMDK